MTLSRRAVHAGRTRRLVRGPRESVRAMGLVLTALLASCGPAPANGGNGPAAGPAQTPEAGRATAPPRGFAWVIFGADTVRAEVARTTDERSRGLMYREEVPPGTGMLFVFPDLQVRSFWMRNTYVALDIAFLDDAQRVVDMQQMEPETTEFHESAQPAMFALEVAKGWLEAHGIRVGDQARIVFGPQ